MAEKQIYLDISVEQKQLKQAIKLIQQLTAEFEKAKTTTEKGIINEKLNESLKNIETLKQKTAKADANRFYKQMQFSKLELQKQAELLKAAKEKDKAKAKELASLEKTQKALEEEERILSMQAKTYNEISKQMGVMIKRRKEIDISTKEGAEAFSKLTAEIAKHNATLKGMDEAAGNFQRNVGDYKNKIMEAIPAVGGLNQSLMALVANPVGAVLAAIAAVLVPLFNLFKQTAMGGNLMGKAMDYMAATSHVLVSAISDAAEGFVRFLQPFKSYVQALGKLISGDWKGAWESAKDAVSGWWKYMKTLGDTTAFAPIKNSLQSIVKLLKGDFVGAWDEAKEAGKSYLDYLKMLANPGKAVVDMFKGMGKEVSAVAKEYENLRIQQRNNQFANLEYMKTLTKLRGEQELLAQLQSDDNLTFKERFALMDKLNEKTEEAAKIELKMAENAVKLATAEKDLAMSKKLGADALLPILQKEADAQNALLDANNRYTLTVQQNAREIGLTKRDEWEQEVDVISDIYEAQVAVNFRRIADEKATTEQRKAILAETMADSEKVFSDLNKLFSDASSTGAKIDMNTLLDIDDAKERYRVIKDTLGLNEIEVTQLRDKLMILAGYRQDIYEQVAEIDQKEKDRRQKLHDDEVAKIEKQQELERLQFEQKKATDAEKTAFEMGQAAFIAAEKLRMAQELGIQLTDIDRMILEQQIANSATSLSDAENNAAKKKALNEQIYASADALTTGVISLMGKESTASKGLFLIQKAIALAKIALDIKTGWAATAALGFPKNLPMLLGYAAQTVGVLSEVKSIKFADGGLLEGPSHAHGGVKLLGGAAEAEGGEYIVNKRATAQFLPVLEYVNSFGKGAKQGAGRKFANGGILPTQNLPDAGTGAQNTIVQPVLVLDDLLDVQRLRADVMRVQVGE